MSVCVWGVPYCNHSDVDMNKRRRDEKEHNMIPVTSRDFCALEFTYFILIVRSKSLTALYQEECRGGKFPFVLKLKLDMCILSDANGRSHRWKILEGGDWVREISDQSIAVLASRTT